MRNTRWKNAMPAWCHDASRSKAWRIVKAARQRWTEVDGDQRAAAFTFYLLLSLFPIAVLAVTAGSLFVEREVFALAGYLLEAAKIGTLAGTATSEILG